MCGRGSHGTIFKNTHVFLLSFPLFRSSVFAGEHLAADRVTGCRVCVVRCGVRYGFQRGREQISKGVFRAHGGVGCTRGMRAEHTCYGRVILRVPENGHGLLPVALTNRGKEPQLASVPTQSAVRRYDLW